MSTVRYQLSTGDYHLGPAPNLLNTNDDWSMVPSIVGYLGSGLTTTEGVDPRTLTAPDPNPIVSVIVNQTDPSNVALGALGGIAEFEGPPDAMIGLGGSDTADAPYLVLYLDSTGRKNVEVGFLARDLEPLATSDSSATQFVVQYRTSTTGNWVNVYYNADITRTPEFSSGGASVNVALPADANNCPTLEVRLMTTNAVGNDEWVGITGIGVSSDNAIPPPQGEFVISDFGSFVEGDSGFTAVVFTISRRGGSQGAVTVDYRVPMSGFPNSLDSGDFQAGTAFTGTLSFADGEVSKTLTFNVLGDTLVEGDEPIGVQLLNPTGGAVLAEGDERFGAAVILNDDPKPQVSVVDSTMSEGTGGTTHVMTFVIQRVGGTQAFDVDYATADGTAIAGLDYVAASGTLHFSAGQAEATVTVSLTADSLVEADEHFFLNLSNISLGFIVDGQGRAIIDNDDFSTQTGTSGDDVMNGLGGDNILVGLAGNDTYFVDDDDDEVHEDPGQGFDAVYTSANFVLDAGSSVEWLSTSANYAATPINLTGNDIGQYLLGNEGANILDGKGGADFMIGFGGDDTYIFDNAGDQIGGEGAGKGYDIVVLATTLTFALAAGIEIEEIRGPASGDGLVLTGNEFAQKLIGNNGSSVLDGAGGADFMSGGTGSDTYYVDNAGDVVEETVAANFDAVYTSVSYALTGFASVEWLSTIASYDTAAINLTGSASGQYLIGNQGANVLDGRGGPDILLGYGGADSFAFTTAIGGSLGNIDVIVDFQPGTDKILLDDAIFAGIGGPGALAAGVFVTGSAAGDADDRLIYNSSTGQLFYDSNGSAAGGAVHFVTLQNAPTLTASDFQVI